MPKIIQHGDTYHEIQCRKCKAVIGYLDKEVKKEYVGIGENWCTETYLECPECDKFLFYKKIVNGVVINE